MWKTGKLFYKSNDSFVISISGYINQYSDIKISVYFFHSDKPPTRKQNKFYEESKKVWIHKIM